MQNAGGSTGYEDAINEHDGLQYIDNLPERIYYHAYKLDEPITTLGFRLWSAQLYGNVLSNGVVLNTYPNQSLKSLRIYNAYKPMSQPAKSSITNFGFQATAWNYADFYQWGDTDAGTPKDQCKYSFYGFIRSDDGGNIWLIENGAQKPFPTNIPSAEELPVVRYILPYPNLAIQRSAGQYKNYYGY